MHRHDLKVPIFAEINFQWHTRRNAAANWENEKMKLHPFHPKSPPLLAGCCFADASWMETEWGSTCFPRTLGGAALAMLKFRKSELQHLSAQSTMYVTLRLVYVYGEVDARSVKVVKTLLSGCWWRSLAVKLFRAFVQDLTSSSPQQRQEQQQLPKASASGWRW